MIPIGVMCVFQASMQIKGVQLPAYRAGLVRYLMGRRGSVDHMITNKCREYKCTDISRYYKSLTLFYTKMSNY
jgi:hypothetical protein